MKRPTGRVLKSSEVKIEGQLLLDLSQSGTGQAAGRGGASPQARIVKTDQQFCLVEVTCCCGRKTYLRCEYAADAPATGGAEMQADEVLASTQPESQKQ